MFSVKTALAIGFSVAFLISGCSTSTNGPRLRSLLIEDPGVGSCTVSANDELGWPIARHVRNCQSYQEQGQSEQSRA